MTLFAFDAMQDWDAPESLFRFGCGVLVIGPLVIYLAAQLLLYLFAPPRSQRMR